MNIRIRQLNQYATLFERTGVNGYGEPSYSAGTTIRCRWQNVAENLIDSQGQEFVSRAVIYLGQQAKEGDRITYGSSASFADSSEIKSISSSPSLDAREKLLRAAI